MNQKWSVPLGRGIFCLLLFLLFGEFDFRILPHLRPLKLETDEQICQRFRPNQAGFVWLGVMTRRSPAAVINSQRLRGAEVDLNANGRLRILGVGSSSAFGAGLRDDEIWAFQLQTLLRHAGYPAEVLNAGVPGWAPFQDAAFIESYGALYRPHAIVVILMEKQLDLLPKSKKLEKQNDLSGEREAKLEAPYYPRFLGYAKNKIKIIYQLNRMEMKAALAAFSDDGAEKEFPHILQKQSPYWQRIIAFADSQKVPTIFFIPNAFGSRKSERLAQCLRDLTQASSWVKVVTFAPDDLAECDRRLSPAAIKARLTIPGDGHPNARYHRLMAEKLAGVFKRMRVNALP
jgi:hypothetical protein